MNSRTLTIKIIILRLLIITLIVMGISVYNGLKAYAETDATTGLEYTVTDDKVTITGFIPLDGFDGDLDIPAVIEGKSVTSIGRYAFFKCNALKSITLPDSVTSLGVGAFLSCVALEHVELPENLENIESLLFFNCIKLESITLPNKVESIGDQAFNYCNALENVTIGTGVKSIGIIAFAACTSLKSVIIPDSCESIGETAFANCTSLSSIIIGTGVKSIGQYAFSNCAISDIILPDSLESIPSSAFSYCEQLKSITIGKGVLIIGAYAFSSCSALESITIPDGVTEIEENAFYNCSALQRIIIPDSVTSIGDNIFRYTLNVPEKTKTIYGYQDSVAHNYATKNNIAFHSLLDTAIFPSTVTFDKNPSKQTDISTEIICKNPATLLTDIKESGLSIGTGNYSIKGNILTIKKEYLETKEPGALVLTLEFDNGDAVIMTINLIETIPASSPASSGRGSVVSTLTQNVVISSGTYKQRLTIAVDRSNSTASVILNENILNTAFNGVNVRDDETNTVRIEMPKVQGINSYGFSLPTSIFTAENGSKEIEVSTHAGTMILSSNMLNGMALDAISDIIINISVADKSKIPENVAKTIGDRPIIELKLTSGTKTIEWNNPTSPVEIAIPYIPTTEELKNPEQIVVLYIDGTGNVISVPSGRYDPKTGMVIFTTTHFSYYAISYVTKTFDDLLDAAWAKKQIEVLASKGIIKGITEDQYAPNENITSADFLFFLVNTLGLDAKIDGNFEDIDLDAYYYEALAIAKKLGIAVGTGNNTFSPNATITRQDMMVLTERALRMLNQLELEGSTSDLKNFSDTTKISAYAIDSIATLVKDGLIEGRGDKLSPLSNTTRAETAVFLYRIYNK